MKKLLYLTIILLGVGILSSCDKIGGGGRGSLVGTWDMIEFGFEEAVNIRKYLSIRLVLG